MPAPTLAEAFSIGVDILKTVVSKAKSTILAQVGDAVAGIVESDEVEWWQHTGFASRPSKAVPGQSCCQGITIRRGDHDVCINSRDVRTNEIYGNLADGECAVFAPGAQGISIFKNDGSVALKTTHDNTPTGKTIMFRISPKHGLEFVSPWGKFTFGPLGWEIRHSNGTQLRGYAIAGLPAPFSAAGSFIDIKAANIRANGMCFLGPYIPGSTIYMPATWSPDPPGTPVVLTGIKSVGVKFSIP